MTYGPTVLHAGRFVHADGQFDLQFRVLAVLGDNHPMELCLLWSIGGGVQDHLKEDRKKRKEKLRSELSSS